MRRGQNATPRKANRKATREKERARFSLSKPAHVCTPRGRRDTRFSLKAYIALLVTPRSTLNLRAHQRPSYSTTSDDTTFKFPQRTTGGPFQHCASGTTDKTHSLQLRSAAALAGRRRRRMFARIRETPTHGDPILQRITRLPHMRALSFIPNCWLYEARWYMYARSSLCSRTSRRPRV